MSMDTRAQRVIDNIGRLAHRAEHGTPRERGEAADLLRSIDTQLAVLLSSQDAVRSVRRAGQAVLNEVA